MKIAFFTDTYKPQINGVVTSVELFAEELRSRGHKVYIFCPKSENIFSRKSEKEKFVYRIPSFKFRPYPEYRGAIPTPSIFSKIKKIRPDIIHVQTPVSIGFVGMIIAKYMKIPLVMSYHTLLGEYIKYFLLGFRGKKKIESIGEKIMKRYTKFFFNRADFVIVPSLTIKDSLEKCEVKRTMEILPTGIRVRDFRIKKLQKKTKPSIIYVGRLGKEKSVDVILKAFKIVLKKLDCELVIVGDGPDRKRLENLAKNLGLADAVKFKGYIERDNLVKSGLYGASDVFVSASATETQGLTILEAFASGCPVIVADALGFKDFVKDGKNGLLFMPGNVAELSEKIYNVLSNKRLRKRLSENAKKSAEMYDIKICANRLQKIYKNLVEQKKNPKVSVIIPALNEEKYIERTLKHIKNQTYGNIEIIVADNGSTDGTKSIAKGYAKVISLKERGVSNARNAGARAATGDILLFVDADTLLERHFVERVVSRFRMSARTAGVCGYIETYGSLPQKAVYKICSEIAWLSALLKLPLFYGMCMAWRRDVFESVGGFDERLRTAEDIDFTIKAKKFGRCIVLRDAKAVTSPRRVIGMGIQDALQFHIKNFFRYVISNKPSEEYEVVR